MNLKQLFKEEVDTLLEVLAYPGEYDPILPMVYEDKELLQELYEIINGTTTNTLEYKNEQEIDTLTKDYKTKTKQFNNKIDKLEQKIKNKDIIIEFLFNKLFNEEK